ncbi:VapB-type antitoxin [Sulfolobus acidocaldarius SUSAZ]|nr:VapB-type antitoxin [Sulfolobus acidocaldarius SUSAZ]
MRVVTIKVNDDINEVAEEMVRLGIARSKNEAFNIMIRKGLNEVKRIVDKRKKVNDLVERWQREGLPIELPNSNKIIADRE